MDYFYPIDAAALLLERPDLKQECHLKTNAQLQDYMNAYSTYNCLLLQFLIRDFYLRDFDQELKNNDDLFRPVAPGAKDLYQASASRFLEYFYLRNDLHIERLCPKDQRILRSFYEAKTFQLNEKTEALIKRTYLNVILHEPAVRNHLINYGPNNKTYFAPSNAIVIGVRYDPLAGMEEKADVFDLFSNSAFLLQTYIDFIEKKLKKVTDVPLRVIEYNEFSVITQP